MTTTALRTMGAFGRMLLLTAVLGGFAGCSGSDAHETARDSNRDAQRGAQNIQNDPHIPAATKAMLQQRSQNPPATGRPQPK